MKKNNSLKQIFILLMYILAIVFVYYWHFEATYQALKEHYPTLKRWDFFVLGKHLVIPAK